YLPLTHTPPPTVYPLSLHDALPILARPGHFDGMLTVVNKLLHLTAAEVSVFGQKDAQQLALVRRMVADQNLTTRIDAVPIVRERSEEHTSELQSRFDLVCRLLLEKQ